MENIMKLKSVYIALAAVTFAFAGNPVSANPESPKPSVTEKSTSVNKHIRENKLAQMRKTTRKNLRLSKTL